MSKLRNVVWVLLWGALPVMAAEVTVSPDITTPIRLSNTDVNRIVCVNGNMEDAIYSKEKGLKVAREGKNAFVKYLIQVSPAGNEKLVQKATEIHLVCNSDVYTIVATPEPGPPQTIYLAASAKNRAEKNISLMGAMPVEQKVLTLIQAAYKDDMPESFSVTRQTARVKADRNQQSTEEDKQLWEEVDISLSRSVRVDGVGLALKEYSVIARKNVDLHESDFLRREFGQDIAGVTIDPPRLKEKERGRLFIVERVINQ